MSSGNPLQKSKEDYRSTIDRIKSNTPVGIDAQYTHAVIIEYLKLLDKKIEKILKKVEEK